MTYTLAPTDTTPVPYGTLPLGTWYTMPLDPHHTRYLKQPLSPANAATFTADDTRFMNGILVLPLKVTTVQ